MRCPIKFCYNSKRDKTGLKWYSFPTQNESLKSLWLKACGKSEIGKSMKVCSAHFDDEDYPADTRILRMLKRDAVPKGRSLFHYFIQQTTSDISSYVLDKSIDDMDMILYEKNMHIIYELRIRHFLLHELNQMLNRLQFYIKFDL